jgi:hypothetical protein
MKIWTHRLTVSALSLAALFALLSFNSCDIEGLRARIAAQVVAAKTPGTVETPVFTPAEGTYNLNQSVVITCATEGADIFYSVNGDTPTSSFAKYSEAIPVSGDEKTTVIKAIAAKSEMTDSALAQATYIIAYDQLPTPQFSVASGTYTTDQNVTVTCDPSDATIYYTTDGSDPTTSSSVYSGAISVAGDGTTTTLKAFAEKDQMKTSSIASATYRILSQPPQWAKTATTAFQSSVFYDVTLDSSGNIYAVGYINGQNATYVFPPVTVTTGSSAYYYFNAVVVKYNSSGEAQWANTITASLDDSYFYSVGVDSSGNVYAAGYISKNSEFDFGNGQKVTGAYNGKNAVLVKYDEDGITQWAKSTVAAQGDSSFSSIVVDSTPNVYAAGYIKGTNSFDFGNSKTVTGAYNDINAVLVKYDANGSAQWAKSTTAAANASSFSSIVLDTHSGYLVAAGRVYGTNSTYTFPDTSISTGSGGYSGANIVLVKYDTDGTAHWGTTISSGPNESWLSSVSTDTSGNMYASGYISGTSQYNFGNDVTATGTYAGYSALILKYSSAGLAQWARIATNSSSMSQFFSVAVHSLSGNIYAAGYIYGRYVFDFGNNRMATGADYGHNLVLVKYDSGGVTQWVQTTVSGGSSEFTSIAALPSTGTVYAVGYIGGTEDLGNNITVSDAGPGQNVVLVKY